MSGKGGKILVVGADGLIGRRLVPFLRGKGHDVVGTTRRRETVGPDRQYLDLADAESFRPPAGTASAVLLAAAAGYEECEKNPASAKVNLEGVPTVARRLLDAGAFTVFVSSFTVFGGSLDYPGEEETPRPTIAYARHKAEGETMLRNAAAASGTDERLSVVRITKSFDVGTRPVPEWAAAWRRGEAARPFRDLFFSPMTFAYIVAGLTAVLEGRRAGTYHLSGSESVDYARFCACLGERLGIPHGLVEPVTSDEAGARLFFRPRCGALGMAITEGILGLKPQPPGEVLDSLVKELKGA